MNTVTFKLITPLSPAYDEMVSLRMKVLLKPIGIPQSYIHPQKEAADILIGAYEAGQLAGCCILTRIDDTTVQLRQMAVDTPRQKTGVGRGLLLFAEQTAKERAYQLLILHAREGVVPFYLKCGYTISGSRFFEVEIPHFRMEKSLALPTAAIG